MAQPKKKTSNAKRDQRRATWKRKARVQAEKALALGKSILSGNNTGFYYPQLEAEEEEQAEE
ncbi:MAG: 50S ribosomal protein L32 [Aphanocapsa lilacina HA4352-LM1]|jgi:large subunit ribosomal protein L32|uniref:Large ribosomal subunit protein bL32 n=2 Tax=Gloeobacter TaxID=33071 RepID=RL32_GLOVI|nr:MULTISPECIES: 50S ribosomal protein L32 [Gloeobacter]Q7NMH4.1 RecName: Full=Large ribosomal subunit protein bL32; AltName: Full=50S ribosomal protein L32 [Gloeobacter violaceus PCC 7421]MBW4699793.1 50S ribosomal protein L32 [Aphanocapsa lilacina HA4352-LM1]UFP95367.1 50S ribosomal protein L32 [Gloeobacter morelensis MG652769]BAC88733.1 50S ribosomal protein L32 [Gloeobacter violaceus PCC 7421]